MQNWWSTKKHLCKLGWPYAERHAWRKKKKNQSSRNERDETHLMQNVTRNEKCTVTLTFWKNSNIFVLWSQNFESPRSKKKVLKKT